MIWLNKLNQGFRRNRQKNIGSSELVIHTMGSDKALQLVFEKINLFVKKNDSNLFTLCTLDIHIQRECDESVKYLQCTKN